MRPDRIRNLSLGSTICDGFEVLVFVAHATKDKLIFLTDTGTRVLRTIGQIFTGRYTRGRDLLTPEERDALAEMEDRTFA